jgi:hypothetical protein
LGVGLTNLPCKKLLRSLQEIRPDFKEEAKAKAQAGLWSQGKKNRRRWFHKYGHLLSEKS